MNEIDPRLRSKWEKTLHKQGLPTEQDMEHQLKKTNLSVGRKDVSDRSTGERRMNLQAELSKLGPLYNIFGDLPKESRKNIISDIEARRQRGEDPRSIIAGVLNTIKQHKKFAESGEPVDPNSEEDLDEAEQVVSEMLKKLRETNEQKDNTPKPQLDLPFDVNQETKPPTWVN